MTKSAVSRQQLTGLIAVGVLVVAGAAMYFVLGQKSKKPARPPDELFRGFALSLNHDDAVGIFYGHGMASTPYRLTIDFRSGSVRRAELYWLLDKTRIDKVTLFGGFDTATIADRLRSTLGERVKVNRIGSVRVELVDAVLDVSPHALSVWHWSSMHRTGRDYKPCLDRIAAVWAAVRIALFDGLALTDQQRRVLDGQ